MAADTDKSTMSPEDAYDVVLEKSQRILDLEKVDFLTRWDSDVMMPVGGAPARASQRSSIAAAQHRYRTDDDLGEALDLLEDADLTEDQDAIVREMRREYDVETSVPEAVNGQISTVMSRAHEDWKQAKEANDWSIFGPSMEDVVDAWIDWSEHVNPDGDPFETLWTKRSGYHAQRYIDLETVDRIFDELRAELVPLINDIRLSDADLATDAFTARGPYDINTQRQLCEDTLDVLGLDWDRARLDTAPHPFSYGTQHDVRITTRYSEETPMTALQGIVHEFGHTAYTHNLPQDHYGDPIGEPRGLGVHESQSRFFENHIARSKPFWEHFMPTVREHFPQLEDITSQEAYEAVNQVFEDNRIRVSADELTYHMHIILRTEIEQALVAHEIGIDEVPDVWADKMEEYLGVRPESDAEGPLQDPHWASQIPAFITYTIGSMLAAQLNAAMRKDLAVDELVREGNFEPIHDWLEERIQRHGQRYRTDELIERATGEPLTAKYFVDYAREKYGELYAL
ncbi:carboxypeptidase M32 [Natronosalvus rutilus]|uniref:Metal-dependent carboxypeptidase n=1 Tax=Natronosalvus rutilus TaxID=2953753 RepID=A0A9E7NET5_9EURY|nr:carboxypeptidase M32 [Natronosalvus rutilus]UTF55684.1 carboxypeptidase M32 [Natronosalvus rutilus]